jgi:hypothetical protein
MSGEKKTLGLENKWRQALELDKEEILKGLDATGIPEHLLEQFFEGLPMQATAIQRAALFYEPVDADIFQMTSEKIGIKACMELIELNTEYLSAPFAREHIRSLRILLYSPDEQIKAQAKDFLKTMSDALNQKERDHFPDYFIAWHRGNIKKVLQDNREKFSTVQKKITFLKEYFGIKTGDEAAPQNIAELANYITARLYGLRLSVVEKYVKRGAKGFDFNRLMKNIRIMTDYDV